MLERTYTTHVKVTNKEGKELEGDFTLRRADLNDHGAISAFMSRINQGEPFVSKTYEAIFTAVATISICGEDLPDWWDSVASDEQLDSNALMATWAQIVKKRDEKLPFRTKKAKEEGTDSNAETSSSSGQE